MVSLFEKREYVLDHKVAGQIKDRTDCQQPKCQPNPNWRHLTSSHCLPPPETISSKLNYAAAARMHLRPAGILSRAVMSVAATVFGNSSELPEEAMMFSPAR
jgi:hypothetical protein